MVGCGSLHYANPHGFSQLSIPDILTTPEHPILKERDWSREIFSNTSSDYCIYKQILGQDIGGVCQAQVVVQRTGNAQRPQWQAIMMGPSPKKIKLISCGTMSHVSDLKLIRTHTTLDLSQKAEKGMPFNVSSSSFYTISFAASSHTQAMWDC